MSSEQTQGFGLQHGWDWDHVSMKWVKMLELNPQPLVNNGIPSFDRRSGFSPYRSDDGLWYWRRNKTHSIPAFFGVDFNRFPRTCRVVGLDQCGITVIDQEWSSLDEESINRVLKLIRSYPACFDGCDEIFAVISRIRPNVVKSKGCAFYLANECMRQIHVTPLMEFI